MNDVLTIAVLQHESSPGDVSANLERLTKAAAQAAAQNVQLLVTPEASLCGYNLSLETNRKVAQPAQGELTDAVSDLCKQHNMAIAYGFVERDGDTYYNTVQIIDKTGTVLQRYRKSHLWGEMDNDLFTAGETVLPPVTIEGWKVGMLICYDIEFPENARTHAIAGAELIIVPTALAGDWHIVAERVVPVRAYENQLFIAYANYCGTENDCEYAGRSCISGPDSDDIARAHTEATLLVGTLNKSRIQSIRKEIPYHQDRLPSLYKTITS
ncbi:MAG: carbon-nitrogen hydrolase family protein [Granulosicoccaceae bacterium]